MAAETPNRHYPVPDENAVPPESGTEAFLKLKAAAGLIDKDIKDLLDGLNGKAAKIHTHGMGEVEGLSGALGEKMPASRTFKLDDLTDVDGADAADTGYVLVKTVGGLWVAQAALSALGDHKHTIPQVDGLTEALASKQGTSGRGTANGYAPLDADGKVPTANLPLLTTTATVGAAIAGANGKSLPADGDRFAGILAGASTVFHTTWGNIKAALSSLFLLKSGDAISGPLRFGSGSLDLSGDVRAERADGTGAVFLGSGHYLYYNGSRFDLNEKLRVNGPIVSTSVVYAGDGTAFLNTDGNLNGAVWNAWGSPWAKDAIDARIEARAQAWANAVGSSKLAADRATSGGFVGGDVGQPYLMYDGWSIEVLVSDRNLMGKIAAKTNVDALGVYALAQYYTGGGDNLGPNQPINGSQLKYASARWGSGSTLPGTWNLHGHIKYSADAAEQSRVSLFTRKY